MKIRVLYVIDHMGIGGAQRSLKNIVENINAAQIETFVCALRKNRTAVTIKGQLISLKYGRYDPRTILAIARLCKEYKIDILHPQLSKSIITCLLAGFICKTAVVIHERGAISLRPFFGFLLRLLHHRAAAIIANSKAMAFELQSKACVELNRIKIIYNPVDFKLFDPEKVSRKKSREDLGISEDDFVVGYVGRLATIKGVDVLIRAFGELVKKSPGYLLLLIGDGPQREALEQLCSRLNISHRVKFLGMHDNIAEAMSAFDVSVVPTRIHGFGKVSPDLQLNWGGRVAMELMRMRIPIVASGKSGTSEILKDEVTALLTEVESSADIVLAVERMRNDEQLREKLVNDAFEFSKRFSATEHVKEIQSLYLKVARGID